MTDEPLTIQVADILVVDDTIESLRLLTEILTEAGYRVRPAEDPRLAQQSALAHPPSLILLDVRMPQMSGFELCRRLKQDRRTADVPIIFVSALQDVGDRVQGFEAGGVDFVSKPFQESEVLARVKTHLQLRTMQLHLEELIAERTVELQETNRALGESEERFRTTFEQAAVGIAHVAPDGHFLRLNRRFCDIVGYSRDEMLALTFQDITHPDDLSTDLEHMRQLLTGQEQTYAIEKRYYRKSGETVWIDLTVSLLRTPTGEPAYFVSVIEEITQRKQAEEELQIYQRRLKALAVELTLAEERERRRIAADLHDEVSQTLAFSRIQLATARKAESETRRNALLDETSQTLLEIIRSTRTLIFDLGSPLLNEIGLEAALSDWVENEIVERHGLEATVVDDGADKPLSKDVRGLLFRNIRELLTNVLRHANASTVVVSLVRAGDTIRVSVEDDGDGMDVAAAAQKVRREGGFGLFSIQERMGDLGGSLEIISRPDSGCTVTLCAPLAVAR